jgi:hypothetical protein
MGKKGFSDFGSELICFRSLCALCALCGELFSPIAKEGDASSKEHAPDR